MTKREWRNDEWSKKCRIRKGKFLKKYRSWNNEKRIIKGPVATEIILVQFLLHYFLRYLCYATSSLFLFCYLHHITFIRPSLLCHFTLLFGDVPFRHFFGDSQFLLCYFLYNHFFGNSLPLNFTCHFFFVITSATRQSAIPSLPFLRYHRNDAKAMMK